MPVVGITNGQPTRVRDHRAVVLPSSQEVGSALSVAQFAWL